ncbi:peptidoglycan recognition protein 3-like [Crotalus tigris]|uniref:peptidoglycan recognition protein 3-like n=1 Tax=Crotalus tigris TaxID=88082 RepID=UPI00192F610A|nr:peptidoglycan recognition protein 3-like [Crotalus tigris]XP_039219296.1 peptidoglycan recognition protein 3-like [Crotalus tigris]
MTKLKIGFFILCSLSQATGCFRLITPSKWGARPANCSAPLRDVLPEYVVIIHTAGNPCWTHTACYNEVKGIQNYHMNLKGWCDVAYSFLIGEDGYVYEGRGWRNEGSHTYGYNDLSLGIAFIGTFVERSPQDNAWKALRCFLDFSVKIGYLSPEYILLAHSDVSDIVSPGEFIRAEIAKWPNYKHSLYILNRGRQ